MANKTEQQINELGQAFAKAQQNGDLAALQELLTEDFRLVGPLGFVLDKQQWLQQYRSGALRITSLDWDDVDVRDYGEVAVAIGHQHQEAEYDGKPAGGDFRVTQLAIRRNGGWALAGMHLSPIAKPA
jgi:ketosteroid isomerase-like protein